MSGIVEEERQIRVETLDRFDCEDGMRGYVAKMHHDGAAGNLTSMLDNTPTVITYGSRWVQPSR